MAYGRPTGVRGTATTVGTGAVTITDSAGDISWSTVADGTTLHYEIRDSLTTPGRKEWGLGTKTTVASQPVLQRTAANVLGPTPGVLTNFSSGAQILYGTQLGEVEVLPNITSDPVVASLGQEIYRTDTDDVRVYVAGGWTSQIRKDNLLATFGNVSSIYNIKAYGAIGDGTSHPLSGKYANLAAAQVDYPFATALTQELDWAALQLAINTAHTTNFSGNDGGTVVIPSGHYWLKDTVLVQSLYGLDVVGQGKSSILRWNGAGTDYIFKLDDAYHCAFRNFWLMHNTACKGGFLSINGAGASFIPSACLFEDLSFGGYSSGGFTYGVDINSSGAGGDNNNELHRFVRCDFASYTTAAVHVNASQAHGLSFTDCIMDSGDAAPYGIYCEYGSFIHWLRGSGGHHTDSDFYLRDFGVASTINGWNSEGSVRLATIWGSATCGTAPVTITGCRWAGLPPANGRIIINNSPGILNITGNLFESDNANRCVVYSAGLACGNFALVHTGNFYKGLSAYATSALQGNPTSVGQFGDGSIVDEGNLYYDPSDGSVHCFDPIEYSQSFPGLFFRLPDATRTLQGFIDANLAGGLRIFNGAGYDMWITVDGFGNVACRNQCVGVGPLASSYSLLACGGGGPAAFTVTTGAGWHGTAPTIPAWFAPYDTANTTVSTGLVIHHGLTSGTPGVGFGVGERFKLDSTTNTGANARDAYTVEPAWVTATDTSRKVRVIRYVYGAVAGVETKSESMREESDGSKAFVTLPNLAITGLMGATQASRYVGATTSGAPVSGTFAVGDFVVDRTGSVMVCTAAGTPGTWGNAGAGGAMDFISAHDYGVVGDDATINDAALIAFFAAVQGSSHKRGYLPPGPIRYNGNAILFSTPSGTPVDGIEIWGAGRGKTILKDMATDRTAYGDHYIIYIQSPAADADHVAVGGRDHYFHDFTIQGNPAATSTGAGWGQTGITLAGGSYHCRIENVEVLNMFGTGDGGSGLHIGNGLSIAQPWNQAEYTTTCGASVAIGAGQVVTPPSMAGIYPGRRLSVGNAADPNKEDVIVTAVTATTFTATFTATHTSSTPIILRSGGMSHHQIKNNYIHDGYNSHGITCNASGNEIIGNRLMHLGSSTFYHGIYMQGGRNLIKGNYVEGISGYAFHGHAQVQSIDASENRWEANESVDCGQHLIADYITSNGTNPDLPNGVRCNRSVTIIGNTMRSTAGNAVSRIAGAPGVTIDGVDAQILGNTFEDTVVSNNGIWLDLYASSHDCKCTVVGNNFVQLNAASPTGGAFVALSPGSVADGNTFSSPNGISAHVVDRGAGGCAVTNNTSTGVISGGGEAIGLYNGGGLMQGNVINLTSGDCFYADLGVEICNNIFSSGSGRIHRFDGTRTASFHDNRILSGSYLEITTNVAGTLFWDNEGVICETGQSAGAVPCTRAMGQLIDGNEGTNTLSAGKLCRFVTGNLKTLATTDTAVGCFGMSLCATGGTSKGIYVAGQVGKQLSGILVDGAWTAGNVGIASVTTAGKIHDNGTTTPPAAPACYFIFLDSGGGAGAARVLVGRTI